MKNNALRFVINTSKKEALRLIAVTVLNALGAFLGVYLALIMRNVINSAVEGNGAEVKLWAITLVAVVVAEIIMFIISRILATQMSARLEIAFRESVFSKLLRKEYSALSAFHSGEVQNRLFNDVTVVSENVATLLPQFISLITRLIAALVAVYVVDAFFASVILVAGVVLFVLARLFKNVLKKTHKDVQAAGGEVRAHAQESVENLLVIKAFGMEEKIEETERGLHKKHYKKKMVRAFFSVGASAGFSTLINLGYVYAILWGAYKILSGDGGFGYGDFVAIMQLIGQIQTPFASLSGSLSKYYSIIASAERLLELSDLPDDIEKRADTAAIYEKMTSIALSDVSFSYGDAYVLKNADIEIEKGKLTLVSGISGIGKSTMIKLLMGVIKPDSGEACAVMGDEREVLSSATRALFAYVPQGNLLMSGTIAENLRLAKENATDEEIKVALKIACADFVEELPSGIDTRLGERGSGLSEGQVQRLAIARAVLFDAPIFLLDEATSALDEETERRVLENIMELEGKTCVCISHRSAAREVCDKEIYIENGKICERK